MVVVPYTGGFNGSGFRVPMLRFLTLNAEPLNQILYITNNFLI